VAAFYDWAAGEVLGDQHRTVHNELGYIKRGTGSPEGVETADIGSIFIRSNGGASSVLYVKESGTGNTGWVALGSITTHEAAVDPHTGYRLESADHTHASTGLQAGQLDHGTALTGLGDDDHPQYATNTEFDDHSARHEAAGADVISIAGLAGTPTELTNHAAAGDPHTGYRLESADHTHASTGLQAGTLDHGTALTGLSDDDHPQYVLESLLDAAGDLYVASAADTPARLARGNDDQVLRSTGSTIAWESEPFSISFVLSNNGSVIPTGIWPVWIALFPCTVTGVSAYVDTGTTTVVNAGTGTPPEASDEDFCSSDITISPADAIEVGTVNQNQAITVGEIISVEVKTAGTATQLLVQIDLTRP
jgi:hypothetical protein